MSRAATKRESNEALSVLLVNQYYLPAKAPTAKLLADVATALAADGYDVRVVASRRGYRDASDRFPRREQVNGVHIRRVGGTGFTQTKRWGRLINYFAFFASAARQLLITRRPDIVVSLSTPPLLASIVQAVAALRGARFVYWVMDVHPELAFRLGHLKRTSITGRILDWSGRRTLAKADTVIALGDDMAVHLEPYSNGDTRVARTWADGDKIRPHATTEHPMRKQWGWEGKFVIAYSGTMGLVHEFDTILDAAARLNRDDRYLFCFIGHGRRHSEVRAGAAARRLTNVEFRDFVVSDQLALALTAPDLHVVSLREDLAGLSVPSKTYSVLAAGKPVAFIGPADSDITSILVTGQCGVHVDNGDDSSLAGAIRSYGESAGKVVQHSAAARKAFDYEFSTTSGVERVAQAIVH